MVVVILLLGAVIASDAIWWLSWALFFTWIACWIVTGLKSKWGIFFVDVFLWLLSYFAAFRLAKPHSPWAARFYDRDKMHAAVLRFGGPPSRYEMEDIGV